MTDLTPLVGEVLRQIDTRFDNEVVNTTAWEFVALAAAAFLPEYVDVCWEGMKLGLFEPLSGTDDFNPDSIHRLKQMTVADVKAIVIANAVYKR